MRDLHSAPPFREPDPPPVSSVPGGIARTYVERMHVRDWSTPAPRKAHGTSIPRGAGTPEDPAEVPLMNKFQL